MGRRVVRVPLRRLALGVVVACALVVAVAGPAAAAPAQQAECWQRLMLDYYDGTIDRQYPIPCYQEAIRNLGDDERYYSSAEDDIRAAMRRAIANESGQGGAAGGSTTAPDLSGSDDDGDSVPVPLLVLGGVALLLVAVGAAGIVRRRTRGDGPDTT
jgi:hypothetical protein